MSEWTTVRLKPDEYKTDSEMTSYGEIWLRFNGLVFKKGKEDIYVNTIFSIDPGCEIEVKYKERKDGLYGKVKYLVSTPRRKYYNFLKWLIIIIEVLSIGLMLYEKLVLGNNYISDIEKDRMNCVMFPAVAMWLSSNIITFRNVKGINKWIITIFTYWLLFFFIVSFLRYIILYLI